MRWLAAGAIRSFFVCFSHLKDWRRRSLGRACSSWRCLLGLGLHGDAGRGRGDSVDLTWASLAPANPSADRDHAHVQRLHVVALAHENDRPGRTWTLFFGPANSRSIRSFATATTWADQGPATAPPSPQPHPVARPLTAAPRGRRDTGSVVPDGGAGSGGRPRGSVSAAPSPVHHPRSRSPRWRLPAEEIKAGWGSLAARPTPDPCPASLPLTHSPACRTPLLALREHGNGLPIVPRRRCLRTSRPTCE